MQRRKLMEEQIELLKKMIDMQARQILLLKGFIEDLTERVELEADVSAKLGKVVMAMADVVEFPDAES